MAQYRSRQPQVIGSREKPTKIFFDNPPILQDGDTSIDGNGDIIINNDGDYEFSYTVGVSGIGATTTAIAAITPFGTNLDWLPWTVANLTTTKGTIHNAGEVSLNSGQKISIHLYSNTPGFSATEIPRTTFRIRKL